MKQKANVVSATVLRRFIIRGERRYDLRDEFSCVWRDVGEGELEGQPDVVELTTKQSDLEGDHMCY